MPKSDERLYLSGPITGKPNGNREAFHLVWNELHAQGYEAINPGNIEGDDDWTWSDWMREAIRWMMGCGSIVMLPGWYNSKGAQIEHRLALDLGMTVYYWVDGNLHEDDPLDDVELPF